MKKKKTHVYHRKRSSCVTPRKSLKIVKRLKLERLIDEKGKWDGGSKMSVEKLNLRISSRHKQPLYLPLNFMLNKFTKKKFPFFCFSNEEVCQ